MYRRKTVEAMQRQHIRELERRDAMIQNLLDRLADLSGRPYTPSPASMAIVDEPEQPERGYVFSGAEISLEEHLSGAGFRADN